MLKKNLAVICAAFFWADLVGAQGAMTDCSQLRASMTVQGYGKVEAQPDEAVLSFTSTTQNKDAKAARSECEKHAALFIKTVKDTAGKDVAVDSGSITLQPRYVYDKKTQKQLLDGYTASRDIEIRTGKFDLIADLTEQAVASGITEVNGFTYRIKDESALKKQADEAAITDAKDKAARLAKGFGVKLLKPCQLSFGDTRTDNIRPYNAKGVRLMSVQADAMPEAAEYTPGSVSVESSVRAIFALD